RDRCRQLASGRLAVEMGKLCQAMACLDFNGPPAPVFIQKTHNQCRLNKEPDSSHHYLPAILVPGCWLAEQNLASRREATLTNIPALHLPPIELRRCESNGRYLDVARLLAAKDAHCYSGGLTAPLEHGEKWTANNLATEEGFVIRKNGCVGNCMKSCQSRIALVHNTRSID